MNALLGSRGDVLPMYKPPTSTGSLRKRSRKDAEDSASSLLPQPGKAMRETVAKQLISVPTEVAPKLLVGSADILVNAHLLLKHEVGHVLLASKAGAKVRSLTCNLSCVSASSGVKRRNVCWRFHCKDCGLTCP